MAEFAKINSFNSVRFLAVSFLESLSSLNQGCSVSGRITAPTTSGPARGPRPTSSIPRIAIKLPSRELLIPLPGFLWLFRLVVSLLPLAL